MIQTFEFNWLHFCSFLAQWSVEMTCETSSLSLHPLAQFIQSVLLTFCSLLASFHRIWRLLYSSPLLLSFLFWCHVKIWNYWETTVVFLILALCNHSICYKFRIIACFKNSWHLHFSNLFDPSLRDLQYWKNLDRKPYFHITPKNNVSAAIQQLLMLKPGILSMHKSK